jgi:hypothetical protein
MPSVQGGLGFALMPRERASARMSAEDVEAHGIHPTTRRQSFFQAQHS